MILREMLAVFGLQYDNQGQKKAEGALNGLKRQTEDIASAMTSLFTVGAIAAPLLGLAKMGSDAQESLNLSQVAFEENSAGVEEWAARTGKAIGRSKFTLIDLATQLGAVIRPMTGSADAAAQMSTSLTELAVDLSSVFNKTETESVRALLSAMTGETESIKRFGIVMSQANLQRFAREKGIAKDIKTLDQAKMAQLRYNFVMDKASVFMGDAARTQYQFANSSRALRDAMRDIGTEIGLFLLPGLEKAINGTRELLLPVQEVVRAFVRWASKTKIVEAALIGLAGVMAVVLLPMLLKVIPAALAFALMAASIEEFQATLAGTDSLAGRFTDWLDETEKRINTLHPLMQAFVVTVQALRDVLGAIGAGFAALWEAVALQSWAPLRQYIDAITTSFSPLTEVMEQLTELFENFARLGGRVKSIATSVASLASTTTPEVAQQLYGAGKQLLFGGGSSSSPGGNTTRNTALTFNVKQSAGESGNEFAERVARLVDERLEAENRDAFNSLVQTAGATP